MAASLIWTRRARYVILRNELEVVDVASVRVTKKTAKRAVSREPSPEERGYRRPARNLTAREGKKLQEILNAPPQKPSEEMLEAGRAVKKFMAGE